MSKQIRIWEQMGLWFTILFFWLIGNEDLLLFRRFDPAEWINLGFTILVVYSVWGIFKIILITLKPVRIKYPTWKYHMLQSVLSGLVLLVFIYWANYLYIYHFWKMTFAENYFREVVFPLAFVFTGLWNMIDYGYHLYLDHLSVKKQLVTSTAEEKTTLEFLIKKGKQLIKLSSDDIAYFMVKNQMTWAITHQEEHYHLDQTLTNLEKELVGNNFFRVNRQMILSKQSIRAINRIENQKLNIDITPINNMNVSCTVSRYKSTPFLEWWREN